MLRLEGIDAGTVVLVWLGISAAFVFLGLYVAPHFLGGTFLFVPFVWTGGRRRVRRYGPGPHSGSSD